MNVGVQAQTSTYQGLSISGRKTAVLRVELVSGSPPRSTITQIKWWIRMRKLGYSKTISRIRLASRRTYIAPRELQIPSFIL